MSRYMYYHYTDINALIHIIHEDKLVFRATNCMYLNDENEIQSGLEFVNKITSLHITKSQFENYFLTSFSENSDSLPMWGMYAANGDGVAIGISDLNNENDPDNNYVKCLYGIESEHHFRILETLGSRASVNR